MRKDFTQSKFNEMDQKHEALIDEIEFLISSIEGNVAGHDTETNQIITTSDFTIELAQRALELHDICKWFEDYFEARDKEKK